MEFATAKPTRPTKRTSSWRLQPRRKRLDDAGLVTARQSGKQVFKGGDMNNWTTIHQGISLGKLPSSHNHGIGKWHYWKILGNETGLGRPLLHPFTSIYPFHILRIIFHPFSKYGTKQNLCFLSALPLLWTPAGVEVPVSEEEPTNGTEDVASPPHRFLAATELRWMGVDS